MADQNLLTIFIAVAAVAVLIQTGILVGFSLVSAKLIPKADQAIEAARSLIDPAQKAIEGLEVVTARMAEFGTIIRRRAA